MWKGRYNAGQVVRGRSPSQFSPLGHWSPRVRSRGGNPSDPGLPKRGSYATASPSHASCSSRTGNLSSMPASVKWSGPQGSSGSPPLLPRRSAHWPKAETRNPRSSTNGIWLRSPHPDSTVVCDRFARLRERNIALEEVTGRLWVRVAARPGTALTLLDIRADGCTRIGAPTDSVHARCHAARRALARTIHPEHGNVEGLR